MGYYLNIIRKKDYTDWEEDSNISLEEWFAFIELDEELELFPEDNHSPVGLCYWLAHVYEGTDYHICFDYGQGRIGAKNPDEETIAKMIRMANILQGKVEGDNGEWYDDTYLETGKAIFPDREDIKPVTPVKKPWWKIW